MEEVQTSTIAPQNQPNAFPNCSERFVISWSLEFFINKLASAMALSGKE